jgi:Tfp pilus assembly protein PilN
MTARLDLDFERQVFGPARTRKTLLVLGIVALAGALGYERFLAAEIGQREADIHRMQEQVRASQPVRVNISARQLDEEVKRAKAVIQHLTLPWTRLFAAIESTDKQNVALLSLQPDASKRRITIGGEARHLAAMLDYVRALEKGNMLSRVYVTSHEVQRQDPQHPVRFMLEASWGAEP